MVEERSGLESFKNLDNGVCLAALEPERDLVTDSHVMLFPEGGCPSYKVLKKFMVKVKSDLGNHHTGETAFQLKGHELLNVDIKRIGNCPQMYICNQTQKHSFK